MNKMRRKLLIITTLFYLLATTTLLKAQVEQQAASKVIPFHTTENTPYRNYVNPVTISDLSKVYSQADTNSKVLLTLDLNTKLNLLGEGEDTWETATEKINDSGEKYVSKQYSIINWYKIAIASGEAYILASDIATHSFTNDKNQIVYFIVTEYSTQHNPGGNSFTVYKFNKKKNLFVDTLVSKDIRGDVIQFNNIGWENVDVLIHAKMINAYCGGGESDAFIVDANNKLSTLINTSSNADDGSADSYCSSVWLPMTRNNKVQLIANGDTDSLFIAFSEKLNVYPFPKEITVPKKELVVYNEKEYKSIYNKKGEPLVNVDGSYKYKKTRDKTIYYRWNGKKLVKLK